MSNITVSIKGMDRLNKLLDNYVLDIRKKAELLVKNLSEIGVEVAKMNIANFDAVFTGELMDSISNEKLPSDKNHITFVVKASSNHAIFVEMGTGTVGASSPYNGKLPAVYAQGKNMFTTKDGRYGWIYYNETYDKFIFTEGMQSRPFMYETSLDLQERIVEEAIKIFGN